MRAWEIFRKGRLKSFKEFRAESEAKANAAIVPITVEAEPTGQLDEGRKWIEMKKGEQIGIDEPHVKGQQRHAHLPGGRAVNQDGTLSHGGKPFRLTKDEAKVLRQQSFAIKKSRLVESLGVSMVTIEIDERMVGVLIALQKHFSEAND